MDTTSILVSAAAGIGGLIVGAIVCAIINGWLIGQISRFLENHFIWKDAFSLRDKL